MRASTSKLWLLEAMSLLLSDRLPNLQDFLAWCRANPLIPSTSNQSTAIVQSWCDHSLKESCREFNLPVMELVFAQVPNHLDLILEVREPVETARLQLVGTLPGYLGNLCLHSESILRRSPVSRTRAGRELDHKHVETIVSRYYRQTKMLRTFQLTDDNPEPWSFALGHLPTPGGVASQEDEVKAGVIELYRDMGLPCPGTIPSQRIHWASEWGATGGRPPTEAEIEEIMDHRKNTGEGTPTPA